ncbi:DUF397 domain-containing protein [Actinocorallia aurantiaca]|uniref:DUF397 domain-containing protein n=1 Tax=Actinocorallia aurantiaca TaxID=46204 RepID=A0ABN3TUV5_9ACTN
MNAEPVFRKSSYSGSVNNNCVEMAATESRVLLRDSKRPGDGSLRLDRGLARKLLSGLRED